MYYSCILLTTCNDMSSAAHSFHHVFNSLIHMNQMVYATFNSIEHVHVLDDFCYPDDNFYIGANSGTIDFAARIPPVKTDWLEVSM